MKHLIETENPTGLAITEYDRLILNSTTNDVLVKGGGGYVDLGLPSGLKWAKCNVGATSETDYGYYFQWGSITPNTIDECTWEHAPFNNGSSEYDETYFSSVKDTVCPNGVLAKEYDAAAQIMGGNWRMPTQAEFKELLKNTTNEWVENFKGSGINGKKITSKKDTSKYIFIPAAGAYADGSVSGVDNYSRVWGSSLNTSNPNIALALKVDSGILSSSYNYYFKRYYGFSVRGVCK